MQKRWFPFLFFLAGYCNAVPAATLYVTVDGNDKNPGTQASPWATLRHAAERATPGDVVKVGSGTYRQTEVITACRGTAERPIAFEADGGAVTLDGSEPIAEWRDEGRSCYSAPVGKKTVYLVWAADRLLLGPNYRGPYEKFAHPAHDALRRGQCVLDRGRLYVRLFDGGDPNRVDMRISVGHCLLLHATEHTLWRGIGTAWGLNGIKLQAGSAHNLFVDAELHHHQQGILEVATPGAPCHDNMFQRLEVHHVGLTKFDHGIYTDGLRTRVLSCRFHHITGAGIHAYPNPFQGEYDGNIITDPLPTYYPRHFLGESPPEPTDCYTAFICWGRGEHRVTNNVIAGPFGQGISILSHHNHVANNTIVLRQGTGISVEGDHADNSLVNNIIQTAGFYLVGKLPAELDYNGYWGGKGSACDGAVYSDLADFKKLGREAHGVVADPRLVDPGKGDYRIAPDSPLRGVGTAASSPPADLLGKPRPRTGGVDLGAYER